MAEIMWRWSFGAAACFLLGFGFLQYLDTLPVSNVDRLLLRSRHPVLVSHALSHILEGSALRFTMATIVLFSSLAVLWVLLSALGRGATLHPLLRYVRERARSFAPDSAALAGSLIPEESSWRLSSLIGLNFLRASLALAACGSILAALIFAGFASSKEHPHPGAVFLLSCMFVMAIWLIWSSISWFLSVASIFVLREGNDTFGSLRSTVEMCRDRFGPVMAVGTWFGLTHLVLFFVATSVVSFPLGFAQIIPPGIVLSAVLVLTLIYFAIVDTLHIGRLAAYVAILEAPPERPVPPHMPVPHTPGPAVVLLPEVAMVDQDELILSDLRQRSAISHQASSDQVDPEELILSDRPEENPNSSD
ncbi:MAG TPA: hypothetical protein VK466_15405 [Terriglobales bacterium]|nr:hypothetical protein [Terriglobales bacterium]